MRLRGPTAQDIATLAGEYLGQPVAPAMVNGYWSLLRGCRWGNGRVGPLGVSLTALSQGASARAILLAMDDMGCFLTHPEGHRFHNTQRTYLGAIAHALRENRASIIAPLRETVRRHAGGTNGARSSNGRGDNGKGTGNGNGNPASADPDPAQVLLLARIARAIRANDRAALWELAGGRPTRSRTPVGKNNGNGTRARRSPAR